MLAFIAKYWIEVLFGLIITVVSGLARHYYSLYKEEQKYKKEQDFDALKKEIKEDVLAIVNENQNESITEDDAIRIQIDELKSEIEILKDGILAIQGNVFKRECRRLRTKEKIELEEWDALNAEYEIYHLLGGNHDGDRLYTDVEIKYHNQIDIKKNGVL